MRAAGTSSWPPPESQNALSGATSARPTSRTALAAGRTGILRRQAARPERSHALVLRCDCKQTTNRPVEALRDLQKAIELNDNRRSTVPAPARSDQAARSASLGRIYSDLGFQQLALVEDGSPSTRTDRYSAHRFLADMYSSCRATRSPASATPTVPAAAADQHYADPAAPRRKQPLPHQFRRPGRAVLQRVRSPIRSESVTVLLSGLVGEHNTYAGEGVVAGIYGKASFSLGYYQFKTDGFRRNATQEDQIANAFSSCELYHKRAFRRSTDTERPNEVICDSDAFRRTSSPAEPTTEERHTVRLGGRHDFSPKSIVLGSFIYSDTDVSLRDESSKPSRSMENKTPQRAFSEELQHLSVRATST